MIDAGLANSTFGPQPLSTSGKASNVRNGRIKSPSNAPDKPRAYQYCGYDAGTMGGYLRVCCGVEFDALQNDNFCTIALFSVS